MLQWGKDLQPDNENALLNFTIADLSGKPIHAEAVFYAHSTGQKIIAKADERGEGKVVLPVDAVYTAYLLTSDNRYDINIPNYPNLQLKQHFVFDNGRKNELHPSPTHGLMNLIVSHPPADAQLRNVMVRSTTSDFSVNCRIDDKGIAQALVPINDRYTVDIGSSENNCSFSIPDQPFYILDKKISLDGGGSGGLFPSTEQALFNISYLDLDKKLVAGEDITAESISSGKSYSGLTNTDGNAQILVPVGDKYNLSAKYFKNFTQIEVPDRKEKFILKFDYKNISSKEFEVRKKALEDQARMLDSVWKKQRAERETQKRIQDSLWDIFQKEQSAIAEKEALLKKATADSVAKARKIEAEKAKVELAEKKWKQDSLAKAAEENSRIERETNRAIWMAERETNRQTWGPKKAVFKVIKRNNWTKRLFVVDVTGSMNDYAQQIKNWYILNFAQEEQAHFVFFNDGDDKLTVQKRIGKTGGVYICRNCGILEIEKNLDFSSKWLGGDTPENDMEALLTAVDSIADYKELILLADNNSTVRDYELLAQLNVPVRIVLCGVVNDIVNEEYLNIAAATKGSVHTVEQDIQFLREMHEGNEIMIGERRYMFVSGGFVRYD